MINLNNVKSIVHNNKQVKSISHNGNVIWQDNTNTYQVHSFTLYWNRDGVSGYLNRDMFLNGGSLKQSIDDTCYFTHMASADVANINNGEITPRHQYGIGRPMGDNMFPLCFMYNGLCYVVGDQYVGTEGDSIGCTTTFYFGTTSGSVVPMNASQTYMYQGYRCQQRAGGMWLVIDSNGKAVWSSSRTKTFTLGNTKLITYNI